MNTLGEYQLNTIITGDARTLAKAIPNGSVDIIFTSPPYNIGLKYENFDDDLSEDEYRDFHHQWLSDCFRMGRDNARLYAIVSEAMLYDLREIAACVG